MTIVEQRLITAEEFWAMPDHGGRAELVRGEVRETMPPGFVHGLIALIIGSQLREWASSGARGFAGVETGFYLARSPDTVRSPDVFFLRADRIPSGGVIGSFPDSAPDLAVEVVSASESAEDVREKVRDYLAAGTPLVWVVYPRTQEVIAPTADGRATTFGKDDTLTSDDVLPGFALSVAAIFKDLP